jgi:hypothetical protein
MLEGATFDPGYLFILSPEQVIFRMEFHAFLFSPETNLERRCAGRLDGLTLISDS